MKGRAFYLVLVSIVLSFCVSCVSKPVPVPGDRMRTIRNIYIEYMNIGNTYFSLEEYKTAASYYELAMQNRRIYWACYYKLALCYIYNSDWASAEPMYKSMLKRDPDNSSLQASLAYIYSMNGSVRKALKLYDALLESQPDNESYLENYLILMLTDKKLFKKNRASFEDILSRLTDDYPENKNLSKINEKYRELAEIQEDEAEESDDMEDAEDSDSAEGAEPSDDAESSSYTN